MAHSQQRQAFPQLLWVAPGVYHDYRFPQTHQQRIALPHITLGDGPLGGHTAAKHPAGRRKTHQHGDQGDHGGDTQRSHR